MPTIRDNEERSIDDLHKIIRGLQLVLPRIHSAKGLNLKWVQAFIYKEKNKPPKQQQFGSRNCSDPTVVDQPVDRVDLQLSVNARGWAG